MFENSIEGLVIELLKAQDFRYIYALDTSPDNDRPERRSF